MSTPGSASYGRYLTPAQARARFGPTTAQVKTLRKWLQAAGMRVASQDAHWIDATGSTGAVQKAFGTDTRTLAVPQSMAGVVTNVARLGQTQERGMREGASAAMSARRGLSSHPVGVGAQAHLPEHPDVVHSAGVAPRSHPAASQTRAAAQACSPSWGAVVADPSLPPGYNTPEPLDVCGYVPSQLRTAYGVSASGLNGSGVTVAVVDAYGSQTMLADANRFAKAYGDAAFESGQ